VFPFLITDKTVRAEGPSWRPRRTAGRFDWMVLTALLLSVLLYLLSFFLPAIQVLKSRAEYGWEAFLIIQGVLEPNPLAATIDLLVILLWWLPNPALWAGIVLLAARRWRAAAAVGTIGPVGFVACGFDPDHLVFEFRQFRVGYYCWGASVLLITAAAMWRSLVPTAPAQREPRQVGGGFLNFPPCDINEPSPPPTR
jgi:hypothetical protein